MSLHKSKVVGRYGRPVKKTRGWRISFRYLRKTFLFCFALTALGGAFYSVFLSDYFALKEVKISGLKSIAEENLRQEVKEILSRRKWMIGKLSNYFLFSADLARAEIQGVFPKVGEIEIEKIYPRTLNVNVRERNAVGVWCLPAGNLANPDVLEHCFYFDEKGVIFEEAPKSFGGLMITIEDFRPIAGASLGATALEEGEAVFFQEAKGLIAENFSFGIKSFVITQRNEIEVVTSENWRVILDKKEGLKHQLSNLKYLLDDKIKERRRELEYVDLRLGNRLYYKYNSTTPQGHNSTEPQFNDE